MAKTMPAGEFKAKCLKVMDEVQVKRTPVTITKRGRPVVKVVPVETKQDEIFGFLKGRGRITGDIVKPILSLREWGSLA